MQYVGDAIKLVISIVIAEAHNVIGAPLVFISWSVVLITAIFIMIPNFTRFPLKQQLVEVVQDVKHNYLHRD